MLCVEHEGVYSHIEAGDFPICTFVGARGWQYVSYCFLPSFLFFFEVRFLIEAGADHLGLVV